MKTTNRYLALVIVLGLGLSCSDDSPQMADVVYTGNETSYPLASASEFNAGGSAVFKERIDGGTDVLITLDKTFNMGEFPVHLHFGDIGTDQADIASLLVPIDGGKGSSITTISMLSDESKITYSELNALEACIKIHLSATGEGRDVILAAGNVGKAFASGASNGRTGIGVCKSK